MAMPAVGLSALGPGADHLDSVWDIPIVCPYLSRIARTITGLTISRTFIPLIIAKVLTGELLPIHGRRDQVRDWLWVADHVRALRTMFERGVPGRTYDIGRHNEMTNIAVPRTPCTILDRLALRVDGASHAEQITLVAEPPGHDKRYAIDASRITRQPEQRHLAPPEIHDTSESGKLLSFNSRIGFEPREGEPEAKCHT